MTSNIPDRILVVVEHLDRRHWELRNLPERSQIILVQLPPCCAAEKDPSVSKNCGGSDADVPVEMGVIRRKRQRKHVTLRPAKTPLVSTTTPKPPENVRTKGGTYHRPNKRPRRPTQILLLKIKQLDFEVYIHRGRGEKSLSARSFRNSKLNTIPSAGQEPTLPIREGKRVHAR